MKKYLEFIKESKSLLSNLSNEELEEKAEYLRIEMNDIQNEIIAINNILKARKSNEIEEFAKDFPKSIFDLNKEQLDFVFEHHNGTNQKQYYISKKYFSQLKGVMDSGFNPNTSQFQFQIYTGHLLNDEETEFKLDNEIIKSITFLGNNLKKDNGYVRFKILYMFDENSYKQDEVRYFDDDNIYYTNGRYSSTKMKDLESTLRAIAENDLLDKDNDY